MKTGFVIIPSGRDIVKTSENVRGNFVHDDKVITDYNLAKSRRKQLLSYRSSYSKKMGNTELILRVQNNIIL